MGVEDRFWTVTSLPTRRLSSLNGRLRLPVSPSPERCRLVGDGL